MPENTAVDFDAAAKIISRWEVYGAEPMLFSYGDRSEVDEYLLAVDEVRRSIESPASGSDRSEATRLIQISMARLEIEFRNMLITQSELTRSPTHSSSMSSESPEDDDDDDEFDDDRSTSIDLIRREAVRDLRSIAERMVAAGYGRECVRVYGGARKSALEASCRRLGVDELRIADIQRLDWEDLEFKIRRWIKAAKACFRVLFAGEKSLCDRIFGDLGVSADTCFADIVQGPATQLFNFADAVSTSRRTPEKLFKFIDLHEALSVLLPKIYVIFESKSWESVRAQLAEVHARLAEVVRGILLRFENAVLTEPSHFPVPGGTIHPLTRYVMNYISLIADYKKTLTEIIVSMPYSDDPTIPVMDFSKREGESPLANHLIWIIVILQSNLEDKSKNYRDNSLAQLFMMNNVHYIVKKIKGSPELREAIGDDYLRKLTGKYRQAAMGYQRVTWVVVLHCLRDEGLLVASGPFSSGISKSALKERFKTFNAMLEEVHRTQSSWLVPDEQLREELRISITGRLVPAYSSFLGRYRYYIENGKHPQNHIKYSVEDLESLVLDFFEGNPISQSSRWRSH